MAVDGNSENTKWAIWAGNNYYRIGEFDGKTFTLIDAPPYDAEVVNGETSFHKYRVHYGSHLASQVFNNVLPKLQEGGNAVEEGPLVRLPDHKPNLPQVMQTKVDEYLRMLESDPYSPPTDSPLDTEVLNLLADEGTVVKVTETVVFAASAYQAMVDKISAHIIEHGEVTVADVRDIFGTSRKYALALMDYLDHVRITRRVGDVRVLR